MPEITIEQGVGEIALALLVEVETNGKQSCKWGCFNEYVYFIDEPHSVPDDIGYRILHIESVPEKLNAILQGQLKLKPHNVDSKYTPNSTVVLYIETNTLKALPLQVMLVIKQQKLGVIAAYIKLLHKQFKAIETIFTDPHNTLQQLVKLLEQNPANEKNEDFLKQAFATIMAFLKNPPRQEDYDIHAPAKIKSVIEANLSFANMLDATFCLIEAPKADDEKNSAAAYKSIFSGTATAADTKQNAPQPGLDATLAEYKMDPDNISIRLKVQEVLVLDLQILLKEPIAPNPNKQAATDMKHNSSLDVALEKIAQRDKQLDDEWNARCASLLKTMQTLKTSPQNDNRVMLFHVATKEMTDLLKGKQGNPALKNDLKALLEKVQPIIDWSYPKRQQKLTF